MTDSWMNVSEVAAEVRAAQREQAADTVWPLFADGPLAGMEVEVPRSAMWAGIQAVNPARHFADASRDPADDLVTYRFTKWVILGRVFWVGAIRAFEALPASVTEQVISPRALKAEVK